MATTITVTDPATGAKTVITSNNDIEQHTDTYYTVYAPFQINPPLPANTVQIAGGTANINGIDYSGKDSTNPYIGITKQQDDRFVDIRIN